MSASAIPGYPVIAPGLYLGFIGRLHVIMLGKELTAESYDLYIREAERAIRLAPDDFQFASITHFCPNPWWGALSVGQKADASRRLATMLQQYEAKLVKNVLANAMVPVSSIARTSLRIFSMFSRAKNPTCVVATVEDALRFCGRIMPDLAADRDALLERYRAIVSAHTPGLETSIMR